MKTSTSGKEPWNLIFSKPVSTILWLIVLVALPLLTVMVLYIQGTIHWSNRGSVHLHAWFFQFVLLFWMYRKSENRKWYLVLMIVVQFFSVTITGLVFPHVSCRIVDRAEYFFSTHGGIILPLTMELSCVSIVASLIYWQQSERWD